jgi:multiple sugar transport system permease protein
VKNSLKTSKTALHTNKHSNTNFSIEKSQKKLALIFLIPWVIGFLVFNLYPILSTFFYSFTKYNLFEAPKWVGLQNFSDIFKSKEFYKSLYNTLYYVIFGVGLQLFLSLITALLLNMNVKGRSFFRSAFFLPSLMPPVAASLLWVWLLNPKYGLVNMVLRFFHLQEPLWLVSAEWAKPAVILMSLWGIGSTMVIYLAGLGDIPMVYYEAVEIDGGGMWSKFRNVTWPMLTPITLFQLISGIIAGFNIFTQTYIISQASGRNGSLGGIKNSLLFFAVNIYQEGFKYLKFGYASALAFIMLIMILIITVLILKSSKKWVYYGGE